MAPNLPGFFYDETKQRYFRITADSNAAADTIAAQYSRSAVEKKRKDDQTAQEIEDRRQRIAARSVSRSRLLWDIRISTTLGRETGLLPRLDAGDLWAGTYSIQPVPAKPARFYDGPSDIIDIAHDDKSGAIFAARKNGEVRMYRKDGVYRIFRVAGLTSPSTPLAVNDGPTRFFISGPQGGQLPIIDLDTLATYNIARTDLIPTEMLEVTDCAVNTVSSVQFQVAFAGPTAEIFELSGERSYGYRHRFHDTPSKPAPASESLAVAYQSSNTISWGRRDGTIDIWDQRTQSSRTTLRLQHPSTVRRLRYIDDHHVLAAGLRSKLAMYDLRWCPRPEPAQPSPAYLQYTGYHNESHIHDSGFDVSTSLGLIAAAKDGGGVALIDLWKGTEKKQRRSYSPTVVRVGAIKFTTNDADGNDFGNGFGRCLVGIADAVESWVLGAHGD